MATTAKPYKKTPKPLDFPSITDSLMKVIVRDDGLFNQFADSLGLTEGEFDYYLHNVVGNENVIPDSIR
jgi:hypothetical protein